MSEDEDGNYNHDNDIDHEKMNTNNDVCTYVDRFPASLESGLVKLTSTYVNMRLHLYTWLKIIMMLRMMMVMMTARARTMMMVNVKLVTYV